MKSGDGIPLLIISYMTSATNHVGGLFILLRWTEEEDSSPDMSNP